MAQKNDKHTKLCYRVMKVFNKVLNCDLCDKWEHQDCISQNDHHSEELYHSITLCSSKSIVFVWTASKHKGLLDKRLLKYDLETMCANKQLLASKWLLGEQQTDD